MSDTTKVEPVDTNSQDAEAFLDSLTLENMSAELGLHLEETETPMEIEESLISQHDELVSEEVVETEVDGQEVEIETENVDNAALTSEKLTADVKPIIIQSTKPLTILPKPKQIPITVKPMTSGQQIVLVQSGTQGQGVKVYPQSANNPIAIRPGIKTITSQSGSFQVVSQQKPMVIKKLITGGSIRPNIAGKPVVISNKPGQQQFMVIQRPNEQPIKLLPGTATPKTITLQQAQEMGLISSNTKLLTTNQQGKQAVLINKNQPKTIKIVPPTSGQLISTINQPKTITLSQLKTAPTKILPASAISGAKSGQRIIFKSVSGAQTMVPTGQLIQAVSGAQNSGQIHQINIPGKGPQLIKFVTSNANTGVTTVNSMKSNQILMSKGKLEGKPIMLKQISVNKLPPGQQLIVVPTNAQGKVPIPAIRKPQPAVASRPIVHHVISSDNPHSNNEASTNTENSESGGIRPRKPCNCTKSQCLKLYCDCFANGEFCYMCNCVNCANNLGNEDSRNRAIKQCLERNPNAFRPKIGKAKDTTGDVLRKHTKGCNCKRSGCLKNYCECYEAKIACSSNCKCIGCRNIEDFMEKKMLEMESKLVGSADRALRRILPVLGKEAALGSPPRGRRSSNSRKQTINYIKDEVIEATCQCLMTISDNADINMQDDEITKRQIIEEFGRCLTEIISYTSSRSQS